MRWRGQQPSKEYSSRACDGGAVRGAQLHPAAVRRCGARGASLEAVGGGLVVENRLGAGRWLVGDVGGLRRVRLELRHVHCGVVRGFLAARGHGEQGRRASCLRLAAPNLRHPVGGHHLPGRYHLRARRVRFRGHPEHNQLLVRGQRSARVCGLREVAILQAGAEAPHIGACAVGPRHRRLSLRPRLPRPPHVRELLPRRRDGAAGDQHRRPMRRAVALRADEALRRIPLHQHI
mmetsp:Transcript_128997/g.373241  ORF Transcript_128997/g.373241 Transcript_128997/m.373241 type:complete len:234 (+) Transcript_128997:782-1483(+)